MDTILAVKGIEKTTPEFRRAVLEMTDRIGGNPDYWLAVMSFETAGTFDPAIRNPLSQAVGLIQFTGGTAQMLGTTRDALSKMSAVEQLEWVEAYLKPASGRFNTLEDHYMSVFAPVGIGKGGDFVLYDIDDGQRYLMNKKLDINVDGAITVDEAALPIRKIVAEAEEEPRIEVPSEHPTAGEVGGGIGALLGLILFILGIRRFKKLGRTKS